MTTSGPLVSIGIPTFNASAFVIQTIESVLAQTYSNLEIVIQDNKSTDNTWNILTTFASRDSRVKPMQNQQNIGMVRNFNAALGRGTGEYRMVMGADDLLKPTFIARCVETLQLNPEAVLATTNYHYMEGNRIWQKKLRLKPGKHQNFVGGVVISNNFSINFTLFRYTKLLSLAGASNIFQTSFYTFDLDLWYRIALSGLIVIYLPESLAQFRVHEGSTSKRQQIRMFKQIFITTMMHKKAIREMAPWAMRLKMARFASRQIGHLIGGESSDTRLLKAIVAEFFN